MEYTSGIYVCILIYTYFLNCTALTIRNKQRNTLAVGTFNRETDRNGQLRFRRDVGDNDGSLICNTETPFQCGCFQCNQESVEASGPCCNTEHLQSLSDAGVSLRLSTVDNATILTTAFVELLRRAIAEIVNDVCQITALPSDSDQNQVICNDLYLIFSNSSATSVNSSNIIAYDVEDDLSQSSSDHDTDVTTITVSLSVVFYPSTCNNLPSCLSKASILPQNSLLDFLTDYNTSLVQIIPDISVLSVDPYAAVILLTSTSGPDETGSLRMDLIITGGVFGGLLLCTCIISAAKAVRDRKRIKHRRAEKRLQRLRSNGSCTQLTGSTEATHTGQENGAMNGPLLNGSAESTHLGPENGGINDIVNGEAIRPDIVLDSAEEKAKQINGHCQKGMLEKYPEKTVSNGNVKNGKAKFVQIVNVTIENAERQVKEDAEQPGEHEFEGVVNGETLEKNMNKLSLVPNGVVIPDSEFIVNHFADEDYSDKQGEVNKVKAPSKPMQAKTFAEGDTEDGHVENEDAPPDYYEASGLIPCGSTGDTKLVHETTNDMTDKDYPEHHEGMTNNDSEDCSKNFIEGTNADIVVETQVDIELGEVQRMLQSGNVPDQFQTEDSGQNNGDIGNSDSGNINDGTLGQVSELNGERQVDTEDYQSTGYGYSDNTDNETGEHMSKIIEGDGSTDTISVENLGQGVGYEHKSNGNRDPENVSSETSAQEMEQNMEGELYEITKDTQTALHTNTLGDCYTNSNTVVDPVESKDSKEMVQSNESNDANVVIETDSIMQNTDNDHLFNDSITEHELQEGMV